MWNLRLIIYGLSVLLTTLFVIVARPEMHKQAIITDSSYEFVEFSAPSTDMKLSNNNMDIKPIQNTDQPIRVQQYPQPSKNITTAQKPIKKTQPVKSVSNQTTKPKTQTTKPATQQTKQPTTKPQTQAQKPPTQEIVKTVQVKPQNNTPTQKPKTVLTEQEEIIAWNIWRSRLQNQVMIDSKIVAPLGTVFKFSFTVDRYGNMSNVKVWSTNSSYTDYAVRTIKPVLMSYRNKPILNFPEGTKRIIVNVDGGFQISTRSKYSSPSDYSDYERVKR